MDSLTIIVALATAILFSYLGYVLGNYYPVIKRGQKGVPQPPDRSFLEKVKDWINAGREDELEEIPEENTAERPTVSAPAPAQPPSNIPKLLNPEETIQLWHDRESHRLFAQIDEKMLDLDRKLDWNQHSRLSLMLIDLQEKVGLVSGLGAAAAEKVDQLDDNLKVSFNPVKSFISYVQADVPKVEEKQDNIPAKVNQILQEQMKGTPLEGTGVSMGEWPGRGVVFIVGLDVYDEIHDIPSPEIRQAIRQAARTWEATQSKKEK
jgi:hypothetical protein